MDQPNKTNQIPELSAEKSIENKPVTPSIETIKAPIPAIEQAPPPAAAVPEKKEVAQEEVIPLAAEEREKIKREILQEIERSEHAPPVAPPVAQRTPSSAPPPTTKSQALVKVEKILEEDLYSFYYKMDPSFQARFKAQGEQTAREIERLLQKTKVKAKEILRLIIAWLKIIPGVNSFFIKQEAKIKTNKLLNLPKQQP